MNDLDLLDNQPLARAACWILVGAVSVLAAVCGLVLHPDLIPNFLDHQRLLRIGLVALIVLYSVLALTASVLGFLAHGRAGRRIGIAAAVALVAGWGAIAAALFCTAHLS